MVNRIVGSFLNWIKKHVIKDYDVQLAVGGKISRIFYRRFLYLDQSFPVLIEIGDNMMLSQSTLLAHDASTKKVIDKSRVGKVVIGNNAFVENKSIILPNVHIGDTVVIGVGSVVTHDILSNSIAAGNPCKVIGNISNFANKHREWMKEHPGIQHIMHSKVGRKLFRCKENWLIHENMTNERMTEILQGKTVTCKIER